MFSNASHLSSISSVSYSFPWDAVKSSAFQFSVFWYIGTMGNLSCRPLRFPAALHLLKGIALIGVWGVCFVYLFKKEKRSLQFCSSIYGFMFAKCTLLMGWGELIVSGELSGGKKECIVPLYLSTCSLGHSGYVTPYLSELKKGAKERRNTNTAVSFHGIAQLTQQGLLAMISQLKWQGVHWFLK